MFVVPRVASIASCVGVVNDSINQGTFLVSWCFEPSQPQRITSGLNSRNGEKVKRIGVIHVSSQTSCEQISSQVLLLNDKPFFVVVVNVVSA